MARTGPNSKRRELVKVKTKTLADGTRVRIYCYDKPVKPKVKR